jgi:hypothetical protein
MSTADLLLRMRADAAQALGEMRKVGDESSKMAAGIKQALGVVGVGALVAFGKQLMAVGIESEANQARFAAVFGANTEVLNDWAAANARAFGVATDDLQGYLAQVANMLVPLGMTATKAGETATQVLELANAWSVWSGGTITAMDAADKLTRGLLGQTRGLMDLGMKLSDEEMAASLAAAGTDKLTGAAKVQAEVMARLQMIQERSGNALSTYSELMDGGAGAARSMAYTVDTLKDTLGDAVVQIAPLIEGLAGLVNVMGQIPGAAGAAAGAISGGVIATALGVSGPVGMAVGALAGFGLAMSNVGTGLMDDMQTMESQVSIALSGTAEEAEKARQIIMRLGQAYGGDVLKYAVGFTGSLGRQRETVGQVSEAVQNLVGLMHEWAGIDVMPAGWSDEALEVSASVRLLAGSEEGLTAALGGSSQAGFAWATTQGIARDRARELAEATDGAAESVRGVMSAMLEATSPVVAAAASMERYETALADYATLVEDGKASTDELNGALLDIAVAKLEAQAALDTLGFDPANLEAAIRAIALALGLTDEAARTLLASLGLLGDVIPVISVTGGGWQKPKGMASGGFVSSPKLTLVGEQGPELVSLPVGSFVNNASKTQAMLSTPIPSGLSGGGTVNVGGSTTVIVQGPVWAIDDLAVEIEKRLARSAARGATLFGGG